MISIRDESLEELRQLELELQRIIGLPIGFATKSKTLRCLKLVRSVLAGANALMREQSYVVPRIATFNDLPPKGWTGPDER